MNVDSVGSARSLGSHSSTESHNAVGRIYQNPSSKSEIWFNLGPTDVGAQRYPPYESWMSGFVAPDDYEEITEKLKEHIENSRLTPGLAVGVSFCLMMPCLWPVGCPLSLWALNRRGCICKGIEQEAANLGLECRIDIVQKSHIGSNWLDSRGSLLLLEGKDGASMPCGPPVGFNLVVIVSPPVPWPPTAVSPTSSTLQSRTTPRGSVIGQPASPSKVRREAAKATICISTSVESEISGVSPPISPSPDRSSL
mmetsp:Transcript_43631/g.93394  ORF Transcript_43631/g.93394 Transcript_43631/m.93394 type:complete len:253 (-) Transcript_43631:41-799(-)|eukprot:CAMPEP_0206493664 /NCGR_PEP_ID=MMETSP0324_2-20121206/47159_1 /ASSEMBLY_ACC=CAM_ASM_000836 /TAXON_ID=2866 /ORGANISM="Crypthecodinium cohnii, Strain Seligo" /LENGTH=252 /DNA_ID=CAMNT_0053976955 /DNA_START=304 /DNA_END=1062 /DNA_ORIENTATION=+